MAKVHYLHQPDSIKANEDYWRVEWLNASEDYQHWLGRTIDNDLAAAMLEQSGIRRDMALRNWMTSQNCKAAGIWA